MKQLSVTFCSKSPVILPRNYNYILHALLNSCWETPFPNLHDLRYPHTNKLFKYYVYSSLNDQYENYDKHIFQNKFSFEVRSPFDELIEKLADFFKTNKQVRLCRNTVDVVNVIVSERLLFPSSCEIYFLSPVTIHTTRNKSEHCYKPNDGMFHSLILNNIKNKVNTLGFDYCLDFNFIVKGSSIKEVTTRFTKKAPKDSIHAYFCSLIVDTNPDLLKFLYHCGLGDRNTNGFGMFEIVDKVL